MKDSKQRIFSDTAGLMYTWLTDCDRHTIGTQVQTRQKNPSTETGKWIPSLTSNQKAMCSWWQLGKGKSVFSTRASLSISPTLEGRYRPGRSWLRKRLHVCYLCTFSFGVFILLGFLVFWLMGFSKRGREAWSWVGREIKKIWESRERKEYDQKYAVCKVF